MKKFIKMLLKNSYRWISHPVKGPILAFFLALGASVAGGKFIHISHIFWVNCIFSFALLWVSLEALFRATYAFWTGESYNLIPRIPFSKLYIEPHPYASFVYKRHSTSQRGGEASYPLHKGKYRFGQYTTNNLRFNNGPHGNRDIEIPKPSGLFRVVCIGASTTGNYIEHAGVAYSYPMELEKALKDRVPGAVEVNNCGQGGYNSADILSRFALSVLDTAPDIVVLYHAYNDIRCYLTPGFDSDYSHCRRNLGDTYWKYQIAGAIPNIPSALFDFLISRWLPSNIRYSLIDAVSKGVVNVDSDPHAGLKAYGRNMESIIALCQARGIKVILNTYCHYLYDAIQDNAINKVYDRIVKMENEIVRGLAEKYSLTLVDNERDFPLEERYFVDSVHFTPEGMTLLANRIANKIAEMSMT